jgi:putative heme-binding domain-containing protein
LNKNAAVATRDVPELKGGDWSRGRRVFFSDEAGCAKCHTMHGQGGRIGPNLSNLPQRDYQSVLRDIAQPSFAINPDYITQVIALNDGRVLQGIVRTEGNKLIVGGQKGETTIIDRDEVDTLTASATSIMPEGLPKLLGPEKLKDLLTFLLVEPPHMPNYGDQTPPSPRTAGDVKAILAGAPEPPAKSRPLHIVLVSGPKDHGPGEHDYPAWQTVWQRLLSAAADTKVTTANDWPSADDLKAADALVFYQQGKWTPERARDIDAFLARGGGLSYIHYAVDGGSDAPGFAQRIGLAWQGGASKFRHGPLDLDFAPSADHPIARNFSKVHFHDESYWNLTGDAKRIRLLATGVEEGQPQPLFWTMEPAKGRVFVSILGHYAWSFDDPLFRVLLLRGIAWSAGEPVDRFNELVPLGARIEN